MQVELIIKSLDELGKCKFKSISCAVRRGGIWIIKGIV